MNPPVDLSKLQYTSLTNSFKNDSEIYTGTLTLSSPVAAGSFLIASTSFTVASPPQFSMLYAYYQEFGDATQQVLVGYNFNLQEWYQTSVDCRLGIKPTSPTTTPTDALIYPVINGTTVTINALLNNPYGSTLVYNPVTIPYSFINYTMTN